MVPLTPQCYPTSTQSLSSTRIQAAQPTVSSQVTPRSTGLHQKNVQVASIQTYHLRKQLLRLLSVRLHLKKIAENFYDRSLTPHYRKSAANSPIFSIQLLMSFYNRTKSIFSRGDLAKYGSFETSPKHSASSPTAPTFTRQISVLCTRISPSMTASKMSATW